MRWNDALADFLDYLKLERGLSQNSVDNYRFDVLKLMRFLTKNNNTTNPVKVKTSDVQEFVYASSKKLKPPSQARLLSGLRLFFDYLVFTSPLKKPPGEISWRPQENTTNLSLYSLTIPTWYGLFLHL